MPRPYPREFRDDVVAVARRGEAPIPVIAKDFGIAESCVRAHDTSSPHLAAPWGRWSAGQGGRSCRCRFLTVVLPPMTRAQAEAWDGLRDVAERHPTGGTLVGGQMDRYLRGTFSTLEIVLWQRSLMIDGGAPRGPDAARGWRQRGSGAVSEDVKQ